MRLRLYWIVDYWPGATGLRARIFQDHERGKAQEFCALPEMPRQLQGIQEDKQLLPLFRSQVAKAPDDLLGFPSVAQDGILQR